MSEIIVTGHLCVDLTPQIDAIRIEPGALVEVGPLGVTLGGSVANTGLALAALGVPARMSAGVGDDQLGRWAQETIAAIPGITAALQVIPDVGTSYSVVLQPPGTDRTFWHHVGANSLFDGSDLDLSSTDLVHLGYPTLLPALYADRGKALHRFLERVRATGATTSIDLAVVDPHTPAGQVDWHALLSTCGPRIDLLTPSADDLRSALGRPEATSEELLEVALGWGVGAVVISDGERGLVAGAAGVDRLRVAGRALAPVAAVWADVRARQQPIQPERFVSTNGAGDAASAGVLAGVVAGDDLPGCLRRAAEAAAARIGGRLTVRVRDDGLAEARPRSDSL